MIFRTLLFLLLAPHVVLGADYPTRPVRLVVPFPPGGGADTLARVIGQAMSERFKQTLVIDNRGGAGGLVGAEIVARAVPDGYTLLLGTQSTHGTNPSLYKTLPYDAIAGFAPIALLASAPNVLVVHPSVAAINVKELIALARRKPGELNYASVGVGSSQQLVAELFKSRAGIDVTHVPYKGTGPALTDLMSGQVQMMFTNLITSASHIKSGKLRGLAVTTQKRTRTAPEMPTVAEVIPGFEAASWYGLLAPAGTSTAIVTTLNQSVGAILATPQMQERLTSGGADPAGGSPQDFSAYIRTEIKKYAEIAKLAGVRPE